MIIQHFPAEIVGEPLHFTNGMIILCSSFTAEKVFEWILRCMLLLRFHRAGNVCACLVLTLSLLFSWCESAIHCVSLYLGIFRASWWSQFMRRSLGVRNWEQPVLAALLIAILVNIHFLLRLQGLRWFSQRCREFARPVPYCERRLKNLHAKSSAHSKKWLQDFTLTRTIGEIVSQILCFQLAVAKC